MTVLSRFAGSFAIPGFLTGFVACTILLPCAGATAQTVGDSWRGLAVAPEHRCTPYDRRHYPYPQSVEADIVASMGGRIYGPHTGRYFASTRQTDIEHAVAVSEAHDSGLCAAGKCTLDPAEWLPPMNRCWFAARVVAVKRTYGLTVDRREAAALGDDVQRRHGRWRRVAGSSGLLGGPLDDPGSVAGARDAGEGLEQPGIVRF